MILQPEHHHEDDQQEPHQKEQQPQAEEQQQQQSDSEQEEQEEQDKVVVLPFITSVLRTLLQNSQAMLSEQTREEAARLRRYFQEKVYLSYSDDASQYLFHMLHKTANQNTDQVAELIMNRQLKVVKAIKDNKYEVKVTSQKSKIQRIQNELSEKLSEMKTGINSLENSSKLEEKSDEVYRKFMEFRKRGYWKEQTDQSVKVKKFLGKMSHQKKKLEEEHQKNLRNMEKAAEEQVKNQKKKLQQEQLKMREEIQNRLGKAKQDKAQENDENKKRLAQAQSFLDRYRKEKRMYQLAEQRYKKQVLQPLQEQRRRKLAQIKKTKRPIDSQQMEMHQNRYEEFKLKLTEAFEKKEQDREIEQKNMEKLKQLYHGRFHEKVQEEMNSYRNIVDEKKKQREKIMSYSVSVKEEHKPSIDPKKKEQVERIVRLLQIKNEKSKKKKMIKREDGSIDFEEIAPDQYKKLGISYLSSLRQLNEGVKRKSPEERSASMMQLTKKPPKVVYPDYLKQMRTQSRLQNNRTKSKSEWRKIISQDSFTNRQKYNSVMDHVSLLESEARQKELELKYMKSGKQSMEMKEKLDKYYLESVAAKMHVLKDVILKDF